MSEALILLGSDSELVTEELADQIDLNWDSGIKYIFRACRLHPALAPNIGSKKDTTENVIKKWLNKYKNGYEQRISVRSSNLPGTIADPIIDTIIRGRLSQLGNSSINEIMFAHRLSMSAENILGQLLEEYLSENLLQFGWHCAWGATIRSVDFCSERGGLLQIKNRSNSENSSSSRVRIGTTIEKWYRIDAQTGQYMWTQLNDKFSTGVFSEDAFVGFVNTALSNNPDALAIEDGNPWTDRF